MRDRPGPAYKLACPYPDCSGENPPQARYCATCGRALTIPAGEQPAGVAPAGGGGALIGFSIAAFVLFVFLSVSGAWRHTPFLMFLPLVIFAIGIGKDRRRRRWRRWD